MWVEQKNKLIQNFQFSDFQEAIAFMIGVAFFGRKIGPQL